MQVLRLPMEETASRYGSSHKYVEETAMDS
jgi:hypothetical protein